MINRRRFMTGMGAVGSAALAVPAIAESGTRGTFGTGLRPTFAIVDPHHPASVRLAVAASRKEVQIRRVDGDLTALWRSSLDTFMSAREGCVVACLGKASASCLEEMSRQHWWQVAYRVEHHRHTDGSITHRVSSRGADLQRILEALDQSESWMDSLAEIGVAGANPKNNQWTLVTRTIGQPGRTQDYSEPSVSLLLTA